MVCNLLAQMFTKFEPMTCRKIKHFHLKRKYIKRGRASAIGEISKKYQRVDVGAIVGVVLQKTNSGRETLNQIVIP